jgi:hypothetical protein
MDVEGICNICIKYLEWSTGTDDMEEIIEMVRSDTWKEGEHLNKLINPMELEELIETRMCLNVLTQWCDLCNTKCQDKNSTKCSLYKELRDSISKDQQNVDIKLAMKIKIKCTEKKKGSTKKDTYEQEKWEDVCKSADMNSNIKKMDEIIHQIEEKITEDTESIYNQLKQWFGERNE